MAREIYAIDAVVNPGQAVSGLRTVDNSLDRTGARADRLRAQFAGLFTGVAVTAAVRGIVNTTATFEASMARAQALTGATNREFERMNRTVREFAAVSTQTATQTGDAFNFLAQAGLSSREALEALPGVLRLSEVGMISVGDAGDYATNIMSGFGLEVSELNRVIDVMALTTASSNTNMQQLAQAMVYVAPIARQAGISIEEVSASISILSNAGIQGEMAGTALRNIILQLSKDGVTFEQGLIPTLVSLRDRFQDIASAADSVETRAAGSALELLRNSEEAQRLTRAYEQAGGSAERMSRIMRDNLQGDIKLLSSAFEELQLRLGERGGFREIVQDLTSIVEYLSDNVDVLVSSVKALVAGFVALQATRIVGFFGSLVTSLVRGGLSGGIAGIFTSVAGSLTRIAVISVPLIAALAAFRDTFSSSTDAGVVNLGRSLDSLVETIEDLVSRHIPDLDDFTSGTGDLITRLSNVLSDLITEIEVGIIQLEGIIRSIPARLEQIGQSAGLDIAIGAGAGFAVGRLTGNPLVTAGATVGGAAIGAVEGAFGSTSIEQAQRTLDFVRERHRAGLVDDNTLALAERHFANAQAANPSPGDTIAQIESDTQTRVEGARQRGRDRRNVSELQAALNAIPDFETTPAVGEIGFEDYILRNEIERARGAGTGGGGGGETGTDALQQIREQLDTQIERRRELIGLNDQEREVREEIFRIEDQYNDAKLTYTEEQKAADTARIASLINAEDEAQSAFDKTRERAELLANFLSGGVDTAVDSLVNAFKQGRTDVAEVLEDMFEDVATFVADSLVELAKLAIRNTIFSAVGGFFGIPGFQTGGSFTVGGTGGPDSQLVAFRASPDERVTIETPSQQRQNASNNGQQIVFNYTFNIEGDADAGKIERALNAREPEIIDNATQQFAQLRRNDPEVIGI